MLSIGRSVSHELGVRSTIGRFDSPAWRRQDISKHFIKPPAQRSCMGVYWFHSVRLSVPPSVRPSVLCRLCSAYSSGWIHFIFTHLIKQLQKVCCMESFLQNFKIWICVNFLKFVTLTLSWDLMWVTSMGNHGAAGVSQNACVLVVLVYIA